MKNRLRTITCVIKCVSPETLGRAWQLAAKQVAPESTLVIIARSLPDGAESRTVMRHQLSDFFDQIRIEHHPVDPLAFQLVFCPRVDADRYWKDLMVQILHSIRNNIEGTSIREVTRSA
jgi:hypothetical protein